VTQGRFASTMSVSRGDSPRQSCVALSDVVRVTPVTVSPPSRKPLMRQGLDTLTIRA